MKIIFFKATLNLLPFPIERQDERIKGKKETLKSSEQASDLISVLGH